MKRKVGYTWRCHSVAEFNCREPPAESSLLATVCGLQRRIGSTFRRSR
ncbi:hypothetical protein ACPB9I_30110 [Streptomyces cellulosae]